MKRVFITLLLLISFHTTYSQNRKVVIDRCINKSEILGPIGVICSNDTKTKWFTLTPTYRLDGTRLTCDGFNVIRMGIGSLSKEDQLFFSFKDGNKLRLESGGELSSDHTVYFKLTELEFTILKTKEIDTVRYINGNDFSSFQYKMVDDEKRFFIDFFTNYYIRDIYCE